MKFNAYWFIFLYAYNSVIHKYRAFLSYINIKIYKWENDFWFHHISCKYLCCIWYCHIEKTMFIQHIYVIIQRFDWFFDGIQFQYVLTKKERHTKWGRKKYSWNTHKSDGVSLIKHGSYCSCLHRKFVTIFWSASSHSIQKCLPKDFRRNKWHYFSPFKQNTFWKIIFPLD